MSTFLAGSDHLVCLQCQDISLENNEAVSRVEVEIASLAKRACLSWTAPRRNLISMSGRGNCYDNAMVETFFKTIKSQLNWPVPWQSRRQVGNAVARYIDGFYNPVRRHSYLNFQSSIAFERKAREVS